MRLTASSFACSFVGLKFWRVNSRKFYAVPEEDLLAPCRKKSRSAVQTVDLTDESCNCTEAVRDLAHSVDLLTKKVDRIFELTKDTAVPLGLRDLLDDHLKCITHDTTHHHGKMLFAPLFTIRFGIRLPSEWRKSTWTHMDHFLNKTFLHVYLIQLFSYLPLQLMKCP